MVVSLDRCTQIKVHLVDSSYGYLASQEICKQLMHTNFFAFPHNIHMQALQNLNDGCKNTVETKLYITCLLRDSMLEAYPQLKAQSQGFTEMKVLHKVKPRSPLDLRSILEAQEIFLPVCKILHKYWQESDFTVVESKYPKLEIRMQTEDEDIIAHLFRYLGIK